MKNFLDGFRDFLEKIDHYRDELLFLFIKPYWPRSITPNSITCTRVVLGVTLTILLFFFNIENQVLIISIFCIGALTDLFDGSVARGLNKVTEFGIMLDPIADRILILPMAFYSLYSSEKWTLLALIVVEVIGGMISVYHKSKEKDASANIFGKTKMVLLSLVFAAILVVWPKTPPALFINIIWISLFFSFLSIFTRLLELKNKGFILKQYENI